MGLLASQPDEPEIWWAVEDLNLRPPVCKTVALVWLRLALSQGLPKAGAVYGNLEKQ